MPTSTTSIAFKDGVKRMDRLTATPRGNVRSATVPIAAAIATDISSGRLRALYGSKDAPQHVQALHLRACVPRPNPAFICENVKLQSETYNTVAWLCTVGIWYT